MRPWSLLYPVFPRLYPRTNRTVCLITVFFFPCIIITRKLTNTSNNYTGRSVSKSSRGSGMVHRKLSYRMKQRNICVQQPSKPITVNINKFTVHSLVVKDTTAARGPGISWPTRVGVSIVNILQSRGSEDKSLSPTRGFRSKNIHYQYSRVCKDSQPKMMLSFLELIGHHLLRKINTHAVFP